MRSSARSLAVEREVYCDRLFLLLCWFLGVRYTDALSALCKMKMTTKMKTRKLRWHKLTVQLTTSLLLLPILCKVNRNPSTPPRGIKFAASPLPPSPTFLLSQPQNQMTPDTTPHPIPSPAHPAIGTCSAQETGWSGQASTPTPSCAGMSATNLRPRLTTGRSPTLWSVQLISHPSVGCDAGFASSFASEWVRVSTGRRVEKKGTWGMKPDGNGEALKLHF